MHLNQPRNDIVGSSLTCEAELKARRLIEVNRICAGDDKAKVRVSGRMGQSIAERRRLLTSGGGCAPSPRLTTHRVLTNGCYVDRDENDKPSKEAISSRESVKVVDNVQPAQ